MVNSLNEYIDDLIKEKLIIIPSNFEDYFQKQRKKWVYNAIEAFNYQENIHYIVHDGQIKPVDYFSTGIVQNSTIWSDGLHQFLQLKHNLKMTCESLTTNFLSNVGFINSYGRIYGMTGTLGSKHARSILKEVYNLELINIPQQRKKQYLEYPTIISETESNWMQDICSAALLEIEKERGVLIICETIDQANVISNLIKSKYRASAVKLYTMNNMNQERQVERILPGEIIIATNLAGRGTDIETNKIEKNGGLHVIVIFMPNNQRVEEQAFGRTARQGKRGTGQMILNLFHLNEYKNLNPIFIKSERDEMEAKNLNEFKDNELKLIKKKDSLFKKFCTFLNDEIRKDIREKSGIWQNIKNQFTYITPTVYEYNILAAIEEQWSMFLNKLEDQTISIELAEHEYEILVADIRLSYDKQAVIKNQYYNTIIGNDLIVSESEHSEALKYFQEAVKEKNFNGAAHVGLAWCSILNQEQNKANLIESFRQGLDILSNEMSLVNTMQVFLQKTQEKYANSIARS